MDIWIYVIRGTAGINSTKFSALLIDNIHNIVDLSIQHENVCQVYWIDVYCVYECTLVLSILFRTEIYSRYRQWSGPCNKLYYQCFKGSLLCLKLFMLVHFDFEFLFDLKVIQWTVYQQIVCSLNILSLLCLEYTLGLCYTLCSVWHRIYSVFVFWI